MRFVSFLIVFVLVAGLVLGSTAVQNLQQDLAKTAEEHQSQILIQLYDALAQTEPEKAYAYAIQAEIKALKYNLYPEAATARKQQGNYYYQKKDYLKAIELYSSALIPALKTSDHELLGDIYNNLGQANTQIKDYQKAEEHLQTALIHRRKLSTRDDEISSINNLGMMYWQKQSYLKAAEQYNEAIKFFNASTNPKLASVSYNNLGNAYVKLGNSSKALDAYIKSLNLKELYGTPAEIAAANVNIGNLFYTTREYTKALEHYNTALSIYRELGDNDRIEVIERNLGVIYTALNNYSKSLEHYQTALLYFKKKGMQQEIAKTLNNIGNLYHAQGNNSQALDYYKESLNIKRDLQDREGMAITYKNMGQMYFLMGEYTLALQHTNASIQLGKQLKDRVLLHGNYLQKSNIYGAMKDYKNGYLTLLEFVDLDTEIYRKEGQSVLAEMMARFDVHEKNKEISELKSTHQIQNIKLAKTAREKWGFIILSIIGLVIAFTIFILYRLKQGEVRKRRAVQLELENLNHELEERVLQEVAKYDQQQQIIVQKSKLESLGNLAAGIAHEINQPLSAISMSLDNIINKSQRGIATAQYLDTKCQNIQGDIERIRQIIEHVRLFSRDQKDSAMEQIDVNDTIKNSLAITEPVFAKQGICYEVALCEKTLLVIGNRFKLEQVLLNLFSNAKDAILEKAALSPDVVIPRIISVNTTLKCENALIAVSDTGCGIPPESLSKIFDPFYTTKNPDKGTGLGLSISYGIIRDMNGNITAESTPGKSTTFTVSLPTLNLSRDVGNP